MTTFINNTLINSSEIYLNCQERQLGKGQDIATSGKNLLNKNGKLCDWFLIADGHGTVLTIYIITKLIVDGKLAEIIAEDEPMDALVAYMKIHFIGSNSGTTCIIVKIFENNMIQSWNVGDSQVAIYVNKQLHYISCPHNMTNPLEQLRLADRIKHGRVNIEKMTDFVPIIATKTTMKTRIGEYIHFGNTKLAMSQALGDSWLTGISPEKFEYTFNPSDEVRVVGATDGFWDQYIFDGPDAAEDLADNILLSADQLIDKMEKRWRKDDWVYYWNPKDLTQSVLVGYEEQYDDIALAIWSNRMPTTDLIIYLNVKLAKELVTDLEVLEEELEVKEVEEVINKSNLDADQQSALDLWQKLNPVKKVEPLLCGDGQDPEFDALANKIFEHFANRLNKDEPNKDEPNKDEEKDEETEDKDDNTDSCSDMPELIQDPIYLQESINRLEQELSADMDADLSSCCCCSIEEEHVITTTRLLQLEALKQSIYDLTMLMQIEEKRDRLNYLLNGNKFYKLIGELNLYEQELLLQQIKNHSLNASSIELKIIE